MLKTPSVKKKKIVRTRSESHTMSIVLLVELQKKRKLSISGLYWDYGL